MRERISLDGLWNFWPDTSGAIAAEDVAVPSKQQLDQRLGEARRITVPGCIQAQFDDLRLWAGASFYERDVVVPEQWGGRVVRLCFGAVDYLTSVWVNGRRAGMHEGGYLPFDLDVTELVRFGAPNSIVVEVLDVWKGDTASPPSFAFEEIPHGKQSWYGPVGGMWQSVRLECSTATFVHSARVHGDPASQSATVSPRVWGATGNDGSALICISSPDGNATYTSEVDITGGNATIEVPNPDLWDVDSPNLYRLDVSWVSEGHVTDTWSDTFGFRTISTDGGRILLNDRPLFLLGALDQDYYLGGIYTPPSDDVLRDQVLRAKELGLNLLRCHIKVPDPRYVYWADRLGILLWNELPNSGMLTDDSKRRAEATLQGLIERDFNHPSVVVWTVINEGWGVDLPGQASHRRWVRDTYRWVKELDPTRLVVDNSACPPNFHVASDLNDFHWYEGQPDNADEWSKWTASWVADPGSTFSPHGDAERRGEEPQVVSEFGNWGLPDLGNLLSLDGTEPWWFDTGREWSGGIVHPRGAAERFHDWRLEDVFGSWKGLAAHSQDLQFEGLKYQIEDMRRHPTIAGYVITELTDVHWECNGLLDMARLPKSYHQRFSQINAPDIVFAPAPPTRCRSGELVALEVMVSHYSHLDLGRATVEWSVRGAATGGETTLPSQVRPGDVVTVETVEFDAPEMTETGRITVDLELRTKAGRHVNRNSVELMVWPAFRTPPGVPAVSSGELGAKLTQRGAVANGRPAVLVAERWDEDVESHLNQGGRAVIVATTADAWPKGETLQLVKRDGSTWEGNWAQGMTWLRPALTEGLALRPRIDFSWSGLTHEHVIVGYEHRHCEDVLAGFYVGWVRFTAAAAAGFACRSGAGIVTTFPLAGHYGDDPLATALLDRLIELAGAADFAPQTKL
jgi:Glycosyl hydrolases family 2, sugar binding domain/Glycosyl hydrolases family 2, TIM barrel domain/Glycosyl hydrolases family 2